MSWLLVTVGFERRIFRFVMIAATFVRRQASSSINRVLTEKKLPVSLREPVSPLHAYLNPSFSSPLSPSITPSLFHSKLKTYLFGKSFPP